MNIFTQLSIWAAPPLLGCVIWFVIQKFSDSEKKSDKLENKLDLYKKETEDKFEKVASTVQISSERLREDLGKTSQLIVNVQNSINKEIHEMNKTSLEMKLLNARVEKWLEDSRVHHGRIIHLDASVQRHEQILITSAKVMKNQNDRITRTEGEIINLVKKKKDENEGA